MISKERLQKLINKKRKIYYKQLNDIAGCWLPLENVSISENGFVVLQNNGAGWNFCKCTVSCLPLDDLYKTEEDAEFAKEFKNITRTETLNLPTMITEEMFDKLKKDYGITKEKVAKILSERPDDEFLPEFFENLASRPKYKHRRNWVRHCDIVCLDKYFKKMIKESVESLETLTEIENIGYGDTRTYEIGDNFDYGN